MRFRVCTKQVPDIAGSANSDRWVMNAYDASALEASLILCEQHGGDIGLVSIGPSRAKDVLLRGLAMGADAATRLHVDDHLPLDAFVSASLLRDHFQSASFDVILCGKQSQDTDAGLTGPMLAEMLQVPYTTNAIGIDCQDGRLLVTRQGDNGQELVRLEVPCLITCSNDMNTPRIPSLKGTMSARKKPLDTVEFSEVPEPRTRTLEVEPMPQRPRGRIIEGESIEDQVATLVELLHNTDQVV